MSDLTDAAVSVWKDAPDDQRLGVLIAYPDMRGEDVEARVGPFVDHGAPVFADSGAFSVFTRGLKVGVVDYANWVHRWGHLFTLTANLDVIGDPDGTAANHEAMVSAGLQPLRTFHPSSPLEDFDQVDPGEYVALGGVARASSTNGNPHGVMRWLIQAFRRLPAGARAHGFGVTNPLMLRSFPFASVDSTSWLMSFRYGRITLFHRDRLVQVGKDQVDRYQPEIRALGWTPAGVRRAMSPKATADVAALSIRSFGVAQAYYRRLHRNPDFQIYIAGLA